jgi:hypothetical protein
MEETEKKQLTIPRAQQIGYTSPTEWLKYMFCYIHSKNLKMLNNI